MIMWALLHASLDYVSLIWYLVLVTCVWISQLGNW